MINRYNLVGGDGERPRPPHTRGGRCGRDAHVAALGKLWSDASDSLPLSIYKLGSVIRDYAAQGVVGGAGKAGFGVGLSVAVQPWIRVRYTLSRRDP